MTVIEVRTGYGCMLHGEKVEGRREWRKYSWMILRVGQKNNRRARSDVRRGEGPGIAYSLGHDDSFEGYG